MLCTTWRLVRVPPATQPRGLIAVGTFNTLENLFDLVQGRVEKRRDWGGFAKLTWGSPARNPSWLGSQFK